MKASLLDHFSHRKRTSYTHDYDGRNKETVMTEPTGNESPTQDQIRVLLADDHTLVAGAVATVLNDTGNYAVDIVENLNDTLTALSGDERYDIVMLDVRMPGSLGIDSVKRVVAVAGDARVVLFTAYADMQIIRRAIAMGACGAIPKTLPLQSLDSVLLLINSGQTFMPMSLIEDEGDTRASDLSKIELLVLRLAAEGMTNKRIANDIGSSEASVKMHMRTICKKLGASNRAHAAVIARNRSILDL